MKNAINSITYGHITVKFCTGVAQNNTIAYSEICIDVVDNDVIPLKFERFRQKALNFKRLYLSNFVDETLLKLVERLINTC